MSYEECGREPYRATCACGKGFLRYYKIHYDNDWGQTKDGATPIEIFCDSCKGKYHYEQDYLIPNGLSFPKDYPQFDYNARFNFSEEIIRDFGKEGIEEIIAYMTSSKRRFVKDLEIHSPAFAYANKWYALHRKKSLKPMVQFLQDVLANFDSIQTSYDKKKKILDKYNEEYTAIDNERRSILEQSFKLNFQYDKEQDELDRINAEREKKEYEDAHKYDDFTANVKYDASYKKDWTNQYWDTFLIKECTDPQYLSLKKLPYSTPEVLITKKYLCVCQLCGKEQEVVSADFKIKFDSECGYSPEPCCPCHSVSSFEAKVMEILNDLGISYIREKSFDNLVGDSGKCLRFDFALYKTTTNTGEPVIDLLIELQGPHHYKEGFYDEYGDFITTDNNSTTVAETRLERQVRYDEKKKAFCLQHGINLECIKYTVSNDYERLENKLIDILKKYGYRYLR